MSLAAPSELTDKQLVARSARGDEDAFRVLFERKHRRVYLIAYQILGEQSAAEDVVQDTFLALWRSCSRYRPRYAVDTWLNRIATNKAIDAHRRLARVPRALGERPGVSEDSEAAFTSAARLVQEGQAGDPTRHTRWRQVQELWNNLAAGLPVQQRAAFALREIEGLGTREVAAALGCSSSAVRSHVSLARKALRARYEAMAQAP